MKYEEFAKELAAKKRSLSDLIRFISTRTDKNPNYSLLLGAGSSITSGIRSANTLVDLWRRELYSTFASSTSTADATTDEMRTFLQNKHGNWYDPSREYSSLFEKRYDLQRQRRMFVETEVAGKVPSIGYAYLTALVGQNYFNTIFTTNFDDLLNEAFYVYSDQRPIVCAHDSSITSVTVTSKRPKIIKLHGDYLFDDLKATNRETESLEQNIKAKFTEFAKEYGLIVIGYSGGDRSVMEVLAALLKNEEYLKGGIYWCVRRGSEISEELRKLVWRERVYFVEIDGFDEIFAEIFAALNSGEALPPALLGAIRRPMDVATKLLSSEHGFPETCAVLQRARERLGRHSKRAALVNLIVSPDADDKSKPISGPNLNDDELYQLTEVQNFISSGHYRQAIERARAGIRAGARVGARIRLLRLIVQSHRLLDESQEALSVVNELIQIQPKKASHLQLKASIFSKWQDKLTCLDSAMQIDPYSVGVYADKAKLLRDRASEAYGVERQKLLADADEAIRLGIELDPSWRNVCWQLKFDLLFNLEPDPRKRRPLQLDIITELSKQNPHSNRVLNMRARALENDASVEVIEKLLDDVQAAEERGGTDSVAAFAAVRLRVLPKLNDDKKLRLNLESALRLPESTTDESLTLVLVSVLRENYARESDAIKLLNEALEVEFQGSLLGALIEIYCDQRETGKAKEAFQKWQHLLTDEFKHDLKIKLFDSDSEFEKSFKEIEKFENDSGISNAAHQIFLLLKMAKWEDADKLARSILEPINYSPVAVSEIVNLELARKKRGKKVDVNRLETVKRFRDDTETCAAIAALNDQRADVILYAKKAMAVDKTFRFRAQEWPIFVDYVNSADFQAAIKV
jgi:tetratricopeptide (TPR) repeat protein